MTTATTIYLVRHGVTSTTGKVLPGRALGLHLSATGQTQARTVAERLSALRRPPTAVFASPLERTRETAAPISAALGIKTRIDKGLLECDFGEWTGKSLATLRRHKDWGLVQNRPSAFRFPDGESFLEMQQRIWSSIERLAANHGGESIVLVSHADPIKAAVTFAQGVPLDLFQRTVISPCSVSVLQFHDRTPIVLTINSTANLQELAPA